MRAAQQGERQALNAAIRRTTRPRKTKPLPYFIATADVEVFVINDKEQGYGKAAACLRVKFNVRHAFDSGARWAVEGALERLGVPAETIKSAVIEYQIVSYVACDAIGVKRANRCDPVEGFYLVEDKDRARLIRQRRLVPESIEESLRIYRPQDQQS